MQNHLFYTHTGIRSGSAPPPLASAPEHGLLPHRDVEEAILRVSVLLRESTERRLFYYTNFARNKFCDKSHNTT